MAAGEWGPNNPWQAGMKAYLAYDKDLQMFIEPSSELNVAKLRFQRWLHEGAGKRGAVEHSAYGDAEGPLKDLKEWEGKPLVSVTAPKDLVAKAARMRATTASMLKSVG